MSSADDAAPPMALKDFLPYRLNVLAEASSRSLAECYQLRYGLSVAEWRVLTALYHFAPLSAQQVGEHTNQDKTRVSRALKRLLEREAVLREWREEDRRTSVLCLSDSGLDLYRQVAAEAHQWQSGVCQHMGPQAVSDLLRLLAQLEQAIALTDGQN